MRIRFITGIITAAVISTAALAQSAPTMPEKFTLTVNVQQLTLIGQALPFLPKNVADPIIADLNRQIAEQQTAFAKEQEEAKKKADAEKAKAPEPKK